jgi:beta-aspartyl-peptidase (threonine type)
MKKVLYSIVLVFIALACQEKSSQIKSEKKERMGPITLVIHGGAGTIRRTDMTPEKERAYQTELKKALDAGYDVLENGGKSVDAVIVAIKILEDSPLFNAGKGSVFTHDGKNEMDASIMDGSNLMAGAVADVTTIKNPITAAFAVMTKSEHVMMVGKGAEKFAEEQKLEIVDPSYFFDSARYKSWQNVLEQAKNKQTSEAEKPYVHDTKFGTVGAVALDKYGDLAAGTSTGGMTNKKFGRIGDSPIIGAGTYADNNSCAVSATGYGEYFIRLSVAKDISALMEYGGLSISQAADSVIMKKLPRLGGDGGVIALDRAGNFTMPFCTEGMYRGYITKKGGGKVLIYKD